MRQESLETKIMTHILEVGQAYKTDVLMYGKAIGGNNAPYITRIVQKMKKEGTIKEREVAKERKRKGREQNKTITLTRKGKIKLLDKLEDNYYYKYAMEMGKEYNTSNQQTLRIKLGDSRIKTMFKIAGVNVYKKEKPSLYYLYAVLGQNMDAIELKRIAKEEYNDSLNKWKVKGMLSQGIYYTIKEVREYLNEEYEESADTTLGSRARGVYLSEKNCYIVYTANHGDNKIMRVTPASEIRLLKALRSILKVTEVNRAMPELTRKKRGSNGELIYAERYVENEPYAIVVSDGDSLVYSMATGNKSGRVKNKDISEINKLKDQYYKQTNTSAKQMWLTGDSNIYRRIFVIPFTINGLNSLEYLCHTNAEEYAEQSAEMVDDSQYFEKTEYDPLYVGDEVRNDKRIPAIYMPVYEVKELKKISDSEYKVTVITYRDMLNAIAHSVRKEINYYDAETMEPFNENEVLIYDENGYEKGQRMLEETLRSKGLKTTRSEYVQLPKKFNYEYIKFYNEIARGNIECEMLIKAISTEQIVYKEKERYKRKSITLTMGEEMVDNIHTAAKLHEMSASAYVKNLIHDRVYEDAKQYKEKIKQNKKEWRNN